MPVSLIQFYELKEKKTDFVVAKRSDLEVCNFVDLCWCCIVYIITALGTTEFYQVYLLHKVSIV